MLSRSLLALLGVFGGMSVVCSAFDGHRVSEGPLTVVIGEVGRVTQYEATQAFTVAVTNRSAKPIVVELECRDWVAPCRGVGRSSQQLLEPAYGRAVARFQFAVGRGAYSALYPIHVYARFTIGGSNFTLHAVRIFETDFQAAHEEEASRRPLPVIEVPAAGGLDLTTVKAYRVLWRYFDKAMVILPVGWRGSDPTCAASFRIGPVARGETRRALQMHPPWRPKGGTIFAEYRLRLPRTTPIRLMFYTAIRDHTAAEPPSDGVTFRVWVDDHLLYGQHTAAKRWLPGSVNLDAFAGREIRLRLESHPGPRRDTTCDQSFWGSPTLVAGQPVPPLTPAVREQLRKAVHQAVQSGRPQAASVHLFDLADGQRAAVALGPNGLADGAIAFGNEQAQAVFDGFGIQIADQILGGWPLTIVTRRLHAQREPGGVLVITQEVQSGDEPARLQMRLWGEGPALRMRVKCSAYLTDLALGSADQKAERVYYGHGYCIVEPERFRAGGGGHNLSTSHVGFDFKSGLSLLVATDVPVDALEVDPERRVYALHAHPDSLWTFVPSTRGAFDCARRYRPLYDKAVARKAGRFVFDLWGGRYAENARKLERAFTYGLTNALVIIHVWQRYGYDYRLPDIFPPNPALGTLQDLQELGRLCRQNGVLWGLHDNYIDFYPDATGFSYERVTFDAAGSPRKAWLNEARQAQSYQWRPDCIQPFLERNLDLIVPALHPTVYFVDVFASRNAFDYWDGTGRRHSKLETRLCWGNAFNTIRKRLGGFAPTISEAGSDHLIGWLDGADCQWLELSPEPKRFNLTVRCKDWERVPWFDLVNHR